MIPETVYKYKPIVLSKEDYTKKKIILMIYNLILQK